MKENKPIVGIIMGSDSDLPVMKDAASILEAFNVSYEISIVSAHRTPDWMRNYARTAQIKGLKVIIAGAGGSAHLPGMTASHTTLPVIGVPIKTKYLEGLDSLLSIAQMPPGVPVATMAINGAKNAALLAAEILSLSDQILNDALTIYKNNMAKSVKTKSDHLKTVGYKKYLDNKL